MTTADWALAISCGSLVVAGASFVWNVWSTFIYPKPRVQVTMSDQIAVGAEWSIKESPQCIALRALNHGPGQVTLGHACGRHSLLVRRRKRRYAFLSPYDNWPNDESMRGVNGGGFLVTLQVGESFSAYFPRSRRWFDEFNLVRFGFDDNFGRYHWAPRRQCRKVWREIMSDESLPKFERKTQSTSCPEGTEKD